MADARHLDMGIRAGVTARHLADGFHSEQVGQRPRTTSTGAAPSRSHKGQRSGGTVGGVSPSMLLEMAGS